MTSKQNWGAVDLVTTSSGVEMVLDKDNKTVLNKRDSLE